LGVVGILIALFSVVFYLILGLLKGEISLTIVIVGLLASLVGLGVGAIVSKFRR